jgi:autotransporter-associated beta strand protein
MNGGGNFFLDGVTPTAFATNDVANSSQDGDTTIDVPADIATTGVNVTHSTGTYTIGGAGRISGPFTKSGAGSLILTSANTFNRSTVSGGVLETRAGALGGGTVTISGGALWKVTTAAQTQAGAISVETGGATIQTDADLTASGISGTGALTKTGTAALNLVGGGNGSGGINLVAGKVTASSGAALGGNLQTITLNGNTLEFTNTGDTILSDATTTRTIVIGATPATIGVTAPGVANPSTAGVIISQPDSIVATAAITKTRGVTDARGACRPDQPLIINGGTIEYGPAW